MAIIRLDSMKKGLIIIGVIILLILAGYIIYSNFFKIDKPLIETKICIKAGEIYQSPAALGKVMGECCDNMTTILQYQIPPQEVNCEFFDQLAGGNSICSDCGNNKCESARENRCNCPQDCKV